jgi:hypothetical protein
MNLTLPYETGEALAVNDAGTVAVGSAGIYFLWKDSIQSELLLPQPYHSALFQALNEDDDVLANLYCYDSEEQPYYDPVIHNQYGTYRLNCTADLQPGSRLSFANDLNNLRQIVGTMEVSEETEPVGVLISEIELPEPPPDEEVQIFLPLIQR